MEFEASSAQATLAHYWDDAPINTSVGDQDSPITKPEPSKWWTSIYALGIAIIIYLVGYCIMTRRRSQREKAFQRDLRRRHGIPDSDTRPFPIAYQEASIARAKRQSQSAQPEQQSSVHATQNAASSINVMEGFRPQGRARPPIPTFPGQPPVRVPSGNFTFKQAQPHAASNPVYDSTRAYSHLPHSASTPSWGPGYDADGSRATSVPMVPTVSSRSAFAVAAASASRRSSGTYGTLAGVGERRTWSLAARPMPESRSIGNVSQARVRKRLYLTADEEADGQQTAVPNDKRSRTAGWGSEAMIDGDNEPLWAQSYPLESKPASDQYAPQTGKSKGKRLADDADGDLRAEGKRRQTKSTKGHQPKPSITQETRGTKRERKDIDTASALNDVMPVHKRGRAGDADLSMVQEEEDAEEEDSTVSRDPLCGGRHIGQKWTANGQEYMVGANGERLRFTTVKESRKRYYMPADSKHADNLHMVEVFVEKWLNEEQYARAKADGLLAWQENENLPKDAKAGPTEKPSEGKENQSQTERPRAISTTAITVSRTPQAQRAANTVWNTPGQSPLTSHSLTNPFNTPPSATTPEASGPRRVRYSMGTLPPTSSSNRAISVWEKQEKEAAALKILRERRKAEAAKAPTPAAAPVPVPTVTITAPSVESATPKVPPPVAPVENVAPVKVPSFSFAPAAPKPADPTPAPTAPNPFSFAPKKDETPKPLFSATPAPAASASSSAPSSFSAPTPGSTSTLPNFPPSVGATPAPAAAPAPSPFGAPTATTSSPFTATPATASKPSPFSFAVPPSAPQPVAPTATPSPFGTSASTPAAPTPNTAPPAPSPFGVTPAAPSPAATRPMGGFTFTPTPAVPPAAPSAPAPSVSSLFGAPTSKPAANMFSFNTGSANANGASETKPTTSGFSFGAETKSSVVPTMSGVGNTATGSSNVFGNTTAKTNVFGNNTGGAASTGFGNGSNNGTGTTASPFTFGANKPAGTTPGFGTQTSAPVAPAFGAQITAPASSTFKFGETNGNSTAPQFGAPKPTLSIPATNSFGAPPSATPTATNGSGFAFGAGTSAPALAGAAASPATPSKPLFNLGAAASPIMGTRQISTSKRVQRAMSKPPQ
ncbi:hypothetical protein FRC06_008129 [Ceratobasidium sp. 370]|nr:hypothetical protein FRC06_008129 [Ceratobasidium sp. 370]